MLDNEAAIMMAFDAAPVDSATFTLYFQSHMRCLVQKMDPVHWWLAWNELAKNCARCPCHVLIDWLMRTRTYAAAAVFAAPCLLQILDLVMIASPRDVRIFT